MKKIFAACTVFLFVVGFGVAQASMCFDFNPYCDGLELSLSNGVITGLWRNTDCAGTSVAVSGAVGDYGAGYGGYVVCDYPANPCPVSHDWAFYIDAPLDNSMIMYSNTGGGWTVWLNPLMYDGPFPAPCTFAPSEFSNLQESSWMHVPQNAE